MDEFLDYAVLVEDEHKIERVLIVKATSEENAFLIGSRQAPTFSLKAKKFRNAPACQTIGAVAVPPINAAEVRLKQLLFLLREAQIHKTAVDFSQAIPLAQSCLDLVSPPTTDSK